MSQTDRPLQTPQTDAAEGEQETEQLRQPVSNSLEHRLLEATATAANTLLTISPFDAAVNTALQILGESLDTDRVAVIENFDHPSDSPFPYWRVLYEWNSPGTVPQISHPDLAQGGYQEIPDWYERFSQGQGNSYLLEEMSEPFRSSMAQLGAKAVHTVPIFVESELWGVVGFDDCREAKRRSAAELAMLKISADCIGGAIQRERTQQALLQVEQSRSAELEKVNEALRRGVERLAEAGDINALLDSFLLETMTVTGAAAGAVFDRITGSEFQMRSLTQDGVITRPADTDAFGSVLREVSARDPAGVFGQLAAGQVYCHKVDDDYASWFPEAAAYHRQQGNQVTWNFPFRIGHEVAGFLAIAFREQRLPNSIMTETVQALSHQVSLALETLRLAEEAKQAAILEERNRFARDIHDTIAQGLSGIVIQLQAASAIADPHAQQEHLMQARQLAELSLTEARRSVQALRPRQLDTAPLAVALARLIDQLTAPTEVRSTSDIGGIPYSLLPIVEGHLFRIAQEAMTNTLKHAQATQLHLKLVYQPEYVQLVVQDNGQGLDPDRTSSSGYGVMGMQERSQAINAVLTLVSQPGQGTTIEVILPIAPVVGRRS